VPLSRAGRLAPYVLAGAGGYRADLGGGAERSLGAQAGGGLAWTLGRRALFAEVRWHWTGNSHGTTLVPVTLGLRF
jgi:hypothetical protein